MRRTSLPLLLLSLIVALSLGLTSCAGGGRYRAGVIVRDAPPPALSVGYIGTAPEPDYVWIDGRWGWSGERYNWVDGYWTRPPHRHARWVSGYWRPRNNGYIWVEGRWR